MSKRRIRKLRHRDDFRTLVVCGYTPQVAAECIYQTRREKKAPKNPTVFPERIELPRR